MQVAEARRSYMRPFGPSNHPWGPLLVALLSRKGPQAVKRGSPARLHEHFATGAVHADEGQHAADDDVAAHAARVQPRVGVHHRLQKFSEPSVP